MILRRDRGRLLVITQPDHAALAAAIMRGWRAGGFPESPRRATILTAVHEHDNGWREVDEAPLVDAVTGRILDFVNAPEAERQAIWPRGVARLAATPYAAALVAQHAVHVYDRYRSNPSWHSFFAQMESLRDHYLRAAAPLTATDLLADYAFVRLGDLISLAFCTGWRDTHSDHAGYTVAFDGHRVRVTPDPFAGAEISLEVGGRELPTDRFASAAEARAAFLAAAVVPVTGIASA